MTNILNHYRKILFAILLVLQTTAYASSQKIDEPEVNSQTSTELPQKAIEEDDNNTTVSDTPLPQAEKTPEISYDLAALPFPTRRMHKLILEATKSGDIEKLRTYIGTGESRTMLSLAGFEGDPINFLKEEAGDTKGHEILAILEEILEAGYVHLDKGTDRELFVWPYFFAYPMDKLTAPQMVELFRIITYGDFQDMKDFGGYIFYRAGITPSGRWTFFVAGD